MKYFCVVLLPLLLFACAPTEKLSTTEKLPTERVYLDEEGNRITRKEFDEKWRNEEIGLAFWQNIEDGKRIYSLSIPLFVQYSVDYLPLLRNLERISGQEFSENSTLVIGYTFMDDLCNLDISNTWNKRRIREKKSFLDPIRETVLATSENVVYLHLYEEGIRLKNKRNNSNEYFFHDKNNFLRKNIFKHPTTCGSFVLVKPNGQALVRNGEYRADWLVPFLEPEHWNTFFPSE